jgi:drug/metabolite transporter (DMT)-like permease
VIWGSTYLAIAIVVDSLPPFLSAALRFTVASGLLSVWLVARGGPERLRVTWPQLRSAGIVGLFLMLGGNGLVQLAERDVPSGLAALIVGSTPLWIVVYRRVSGQRIGRGVLAGVLVGFIGVGFLVLPRGISGEVAPIGLLFMLAASASWGWGTFISGRIAMPRDALVSTTLQQLIGGLGLLAAGVVTGEVGRLDPSAWSDRSVWALAYLVVFGSLVAFSAFTWLVAHVPVSTVATYAYVNPVVAVILGSLILAEPVTPTILIGAALVLASVAAIVRQQRPSGDVASGPSPTR